MEIWELCDLQGSSGSPSTCWAKNFTKSQNFRFSFCFQTQVKYLFFFFHYFKWLTLNSCWFETCCLDARDSDCFFLVIFLLFLRRSCFRILAWVIRCVSWTTWHYLPSCELRAPASLFESSICLSQEFRLVCLSPRLQGHAVSNQELCTSTEEAGHWAVHVSGLIVKHHLMAQLVNI